MAQAKYTGKLRGKSVVIFGGSSGIGYAVAEAALESHASVIVASSNAGEVQSAIGRLKSSFPSIGPSQISGYVCDLGGNDMEHNISAFFEQVVGGKGPGDGGKIDHIVFTAGDQLHMGDIQDFSYERVIRAGQVRFFAPLFVAKLGMRYLAPRPQSSITFSAGQVIQKPLPHHAIITSYAAGMVGMVRALAVDLRPVRVNLVSPGPADTEMWTHLGDTQLEGLRKSVGQMMLTGEIGKPEDIAEAYMCSLRNNNMTGAHLYTDGGMPLAPSPAAEH